MTPRFPRRHNRIFVAAAPRGKPAAMLMVRILDGPHKGTCWQKFDFVPMVMFNWAICERAFESHVAYIEVGKKEGLPVADAKALGTATCRLSRTRPWSSTSSCPRTRTGSPLPGAKRIGCDGASRLQAAALRWRAWKGFIPRTAAEFPTLPWHTAS